MQAKLSNIFIFFLTLILLFVVLEISSNIYLKNFADDNTFLRYGSFDQLQSRAIDNKTKFSPHRYLDYIPTPNYITDVNKHNSLGYRGDEIDIPKPNGRIRIVCLGGSTTYTGQVKNYQKSYPYLLEKCLHDSGISNVDVVNAGASGWSSWESLINFEFRILDLAPDIIIIYHGINDIHPRLVWPPESYTGDNSGSRIHSQADVFVPSIFERSTLLRILMIRTNLTLPHATFERTVNKLPATFYGVLFREQKYQGNYPEGIFTKVSGAKMLQTNQPKYYERNIRNIVAIAKMHGIKVVLSSFAYSSLFTDMPRVSSEEYISAYEETNELTKSISISTNTHFFDFANVFPTDKELYEDGRHVNEAGSQLKAQLFCSFLLKSGLLLSDTTYHEIEFYQK